MVCVGGQGRTIVGDDAAAGWLERFHAGDRGALEVVYREQFDAVSHAVGRVLHGADRETVVHELFLALVEDGGLRRAFRGGGLRAWLSTVAYRRAIDFARRHGREHLVATDDVRELAGRLEQEPPPSALDAVIAAEAQRIVADFRRERLPAKWAPVFEARFLQQLSQRDAARALGMRRTTLAYQEARVRRLLRAFVLRAAHPGGGGAPWERGTP